jgi:hypothetical protein
MSVLARGSWTTTPPATGLSRVFTLHATHLALANEEANQVRFLEPGGNGMERRAKEAEKLTRMFDSGSPQAAVGKRSCAFDRSSMRD